MERRHLRLALIIAVVVGVAVAFQANLTSAAQRTMGPVAMVALRLSDVAPDGRATRISYGLLNLTHRAGHDRPEALTPGQRCQVSVTLNAIAQAIPPDHRLRLALSTSYWPLAWPPPQPVRLTVYPTASALVLPLRPDPGSNEPPLPSLGEPDLGLFAPLDAPR